MLARDRVRRTIKPPSRFEDSDFAAYALAVSEEIEINEPESYKEAMMSKKSKFWKNVAREEMNSLQRARTWTLIERPENAKVIGSKWIFKLNLEYLESKIRGIKADWWLRDFLKRRGSTTMKCFHL